MEEEKLLDVVGLIALRKTELAHKVITTLKKDGLIDKNDKEKVEAIIRYISEIENEKLLSDAEKRTKKLNPKLKIGELGIDINNIIKEIKNKFWNIL